LLFACSRCNLRSYFQCTSPTCLRKHCGHLPMVSAGLVSHQMNSLARRSGFPPSKNSFHMSSFFCPLDLGILTKIPMPPVTNTHNPASTHTHGKSLRRPTRLNTPNIQAVNHFVTPNPHPRKRYPSKSASGRPHWAIFLPPSSTPFSVHLMPAVCGSYSGESFLTHVHFTLSVFCPLRLSFTSVTSL
jgi:hypothetical protein